MSTPQPPIEKIQVRLSNGQTVEVLAILDPDEHTHAYLLAIARDLIAATLGPLPSDVAVTHVYFEPKYLGEVAA